MRITAVSDINYGGAANALSRLVAGFNSMPGVKVQWLHAGKRDMGGMCISSWQSVISVILERASLKVDEKLARQCRYRVARKSLRHALLANDAEVLNIHNIHEVFNMGALDVLPKGVPLVWTLHDLWPLTGYCCYSGSCEKYLSGCNGDCPEMGKWGAMSGSVHKGWLCREKWIERNADRLCLVSPSKWLAECARNRFTGRVRVEQIPYGLPLDVFRPLFSEEIGSGNLCGEASLRERTDVMKCGHRVDGLKSVIRRMLGLPETGRLVLFVTARLDDPRKGLKMLVDAAFVLKQRYGDGINFVCVGEDSSADTIPSFFLCKGIVRDEALLNMYYNAADVFVHPARQDNLPNTILEALAAGTPSVAFDVGGCGDVVRDGQTGRLLGEPDADSLASGIQDLLELPHDRMLQMRQKCRQVAEQEYSAELQASRYKALFEEMLARQHTKLGNEVTH